MTDATPRVAESCPPLFYDRGVGREAEAIRSAIRNALDDRARSESLSRLHRELCEDLWKACQEASHPNWDGHGGLPVDYDTYRQAQAFISTLPPSIPTPDIVPEPDGEIALEWSAGRNWTFSVSVGRTGRLSYAALLGARKAYGSERSICGFPHAIAKALGAITRRVEAER